jgi:hypothetical protein
MDQVLLETAHAEEVLEFLRRIVSPVYGANLLFCFSHIRLPVLDGKDDKKKVAEYRKTCYDSGTIPFTRFPLVYSSDKRRFIPQPGVDIMVGGEYSPFSEDPASIQDLVMSGNFHEFQVSFGLGPQVEEAYRLFVSGDEGRVENSLMSCLELNDFYVRAGLIKTEGGAKMLAISEEEGRTIIKQLDSHPDNPLRYPQD